MSFVGFGVPCLATPRGHAGCSNVFIGRSLKTAPMILYGIVVSACLYNPVFARAKSCRSSHSYYKSSDGRWVHGPRCFNHPLKVLRRFAGTARRAFRIIIAGHARTTGAWHGGSKVRFSYDLANLISGPKSWLSAA